MDEYVFEVLFLFGADAGIGGNLSYFIVDDNLLVGVKLFVSFSKHGLLFYFHLSSSSNSKGSLGCSLAIKRSRITSMGKSGLANALRPIFAQKFICWGALRYSALPSLAAASNKSLSMRMLTLLMKIPPCLW